MAPRLQTKTIPQCLQCLRSYTLAGLPDAKHSFGAIVQTRGKKTSSSTAKGPEQTVRLLKNMKGIGRRGDFVPVMAGKMRNLWVPNRIAEYVSDAEIRAYRLSKLPAENEQADNGDGAGMQSMLRSRKQAPKFVIQTLTAPETGKMIEKYLPMELVFFRKVVPTKPTRSEPKKPADQRRSRDAGDEMLAARAQVIKEQEEALTASQQPQAIYGSVTTTDVHQTILDTLAKRLNDRPMPLSADDIILSDDSREVLVQGNKIRHTGAFLVEIKVPGSQAVIRRIAHVRDQIEQEQQSEQKEAGILDYL